MTLNDYDLNLDEFDYSGYNSSVEKYKPQAEMYAKLAMIGLKAEIEKLKKLSGEKRILAEDELTFSESND